MRNKENISDKEVHDMQKSGMIELKECELIDMLDNLGYKINHKYTFNYINNLNENTYKAVSIDIVCKDTDLSFSHIDADKTNLSKLQIIRKNFFVYKNGRIWEL